MTRTRRRTRGGAYNPRWDRPLRTLLLALYEERRPGFREREQASKNASRAAGRAMRDVDVLTKSRLRLAALAADAADAAARAPPEARAAADAAWSAARDNAYLEEQEERRAKESVSRLNAAAKEAAAAYANELKMSEKFIADRLLPAEEAIKNRQLSFRYNGEVIYFPRSPLFSGWGRRTRHTKPRRRGRKA